ncbi:uncharacterized protein EMH_0089600 [Eimeria mitis]|uniref:Transmembrane protein n=1 Tax=Eimeria mitis TaxID=44415 RepID=U6KIC0_9EIME|nr:uncharacterized protein EMH_0089600 [Eimeria mitis]CDJ36536.1 hypothetical protein, conserved [Eimeria mitis]
MKHVGVWGVVLLLSPSPCCLQWVAASESPAVYRPEEVNAEVQNENWGQAVDSLIETESSQQQSLQTSLDAAENPGEAAAPVAEGAGALADDAADSNKTEGLKASAKNVAIGASLLLFFMGLFLLTGKKGAAAPPSFDEEEEPLKEPELTPEEQRERQLERMQEICDAAEKIATATGAAEADVLHAGMKKNLQQAREAPDERTFKDHIAAANNLASEVDALAKDYIFALVEKHATAPPFPDVTLKEEEKDVPLLELLEGFGGSTSVRCAAKALRSLKDKAENASETVRKVGDYLTNTPTYKNDEDKARLEQRASGIEYLNAMVASHSRDLAVGSKLKEVAVEGFHTLLFRDHKESVLLYDGDCDLLKITLNAMQTRDLPPGVDVSEYKNECTSVEKRINDLQGRVDEMRTHLEEVQRSRSLQASYRTSLELGKISEQAAAEVNALWAVLEELNIGFEAGGYRNRDLVPDRIKRACDTVTPECNAILNRLREVRKRVDNLSKDRQGASGGFPLNQSILANILSSVEGLQKMADVIEGKAREIVQIYPGITNPKDVSDLSAEYKDHLIALTRGRATADLSNVEVTLFTIFEDELRRLVKDAEEASAFKFPLNSPLEKKMFRLKMRFDEKAEVGKHAETLTTVEEALASSRVVLFSMHQLIRDSLMRNVH